MQQVPVQSVICFNLQSSQSAVFYAFIAQKKDILHHEQALYNWMRSSSNLLYYIDRKHMLCSVLPDTCLCNH